MRDPHRFAYRGLVVSSNPFIVVYADGDAVATAGHAACEMAATALMQLDAAQAAVVLCSGRTRAEVEFLQQKLGLHDPMICEYGGAVFIPDGYFGRDIPNARTVAGHVAIEFGRPYADVVDVLRRTAARVGVTIVAFHEMSIAEVARELGVTLLEGRLAKLREYGELFRVAGGTADRSRLFKALRSVGLQCGAGHRFDFVGVPVDYAVGLNLLNRLYRAAHGTILRAAVGVTDGDDTPAGLVDHHERVPHADAASSLGVVAWAETIVEVTRMLQRRPVAPNAC